MSDEKWAAKHWLNVPGPFYTGDTDTCWTGRLHAPRHVLYGGRYQNEFIYRQPRTPDEIQSVREAGEQDPLDGYADDGDERWTPGAVRAWWHDRDKVVEHITELIAEWTAGTRSDEPDAAEGGRDFLAYLAGDLEADLRAYVFRLENGRYPAASDRVPEL
ncbi:hypothetical protein JNUCC0626_15310 [Lentzea sp. JNUCC 0626]|uniref:hypothetical protein n=1 Tax=Lentzea sp. JNUCC 0626 TaxID=3367513 RepID=UPI003748AEB2